MFIDDITMNLNLKVLGGPIPRNRLSKIRIPHQAAHAFDWIMNEGSLSGTSGQFRMPNNPTKAVIFLVREDASSQMANPFHLMDNGCVEVQLDLNGKMHTIPINKTEGKDDVDLYYSLFRAMGLNIPTGQWLFGRQMVFEGMFMVAFDLTRSGMLNQVDTLDADVSK